MHTFSILTSLSLLFGALALPATLEERSCQTLYAPLLNRLPQHLPDDGSPGTTTPFYVWNEIGKTDLLAEFRYIPSGAYGCTLQFDYQPGNNPIVEDDIGDPQRIDVYRVSDGGNFPYTPTWDNTGPRTGALVGTFQFPSGNALNTPQLITINSFACDAIMAFRFTVEDDNARGGVQVDEGTTSGLRIAYNC
jgi:hypothetical protein